MRNHFFFPDFPRRRNSKPHLGPISYNISHWSKLQNDHLSPENSAPNFAVCCNSCTPKPSNNGLPVRFQHRELRKLHCTRSFGDSSVCHQQSWLHQFVSTFQKKKSKWKGAHIVVYLKFHSKLCRSSGKLAWRSAKFAVKLQLIKVARDSCDVTHSLTQANMHTSYVHGSKSCTKYSLHFEQSTSRHTFVIMLYGVRCSLYEVGQF